MLYRYSYKTSDGVRHEDEMSADSREDAFAELRRRGIRAIRVEECEGAPAKRRAWPWIVIVVAAVFAAIAAAVAAYLHSSGVRYQEETRPVFADLRSKAAAIQSQYESGIRLLDLKVLENYALLAGHADLSAITNETRKARDVLSQARAQAGDLFCGVLEMFPPESVNERIDAQKMYGELMNGIDATEGRIRQDERALELLDASRDKWGVGEDGRIVFSDPRLRMEMEFFGRNRDEATARWKMDFGDAERKERRQ